MSRLRDDAADFGGAIDNAAAALRLAAEFVEKDYWVTQVLRALKVRFPGQFVFKGGTSLSKGYNLIERFSEDVDILVLPTKGDSARTREALLRRMTEAVAGELDLPWLQAREPGRGRFAHRADVLVYPRRPRPPAVVTPVEDRGVLLETGFAGGIWPSEMVAITPILCAPLSIDPAEYEDTAAFDVQALKPARTLLEKLSLLHHVALAYDEGDGRDHRCGRHYYDIFSLLDHGPTRRVLEDRREFARIMSEMEDISAQHYGGAWRSRPDGGYAESPAFAPATRTELEQWLAARYADSAALLPKVKRRSLPSFDKVLARIEQHRKLL